VPAPMALPALSPKLLEPLNEFPFDHMPRTIAHRDRVVTSRPGAYRRTMARKGTGPQRGRLADMSLPPEERHRRTGRAADPVPAQMQHGNSRHGRAQRRDWERAMKREQREASPAEAAGPASTPGPPRP
jgi:hypothetical protein